MTPAGMKLITAPGSDKALVRLEVHGFLDYECADHFLALASRPLEDSPDLRALHLDCRHLDGLDSMGLAMILTLRRRTAAAGVTLSLDNRPPVLERMLDITGTLEYLVPGRADAPDASADFERPAHRRTAEDGSPGPG
ncbi:STAS domain-containing protein [Streptomyces asoensis]|uniref:STAS domain-containing protein n=1 Tax=Streptomyces asoensis TaxID=249586 RepID=UPI0033C7898B